MPTPSPKVCRSKTLGPEGTDRGVNTKGTEEEACATPEPFPADPFLEATPERGQQSMHSSSRQGGDKLRAQRSDRRLTGRRFICERPIRQKRPGVQSLTTRASALDRGGCHTPYICPDIQDAN